MAKVEEYLCFLVLDLQVSYVVDIVGIIDLQWRTGGTASSAWTCCSYSYHAWGVALVINLSMNRNLMVLHKPNLVTTSRLPVILLWPSMTTKFLFA
ncbi:hypothetical protein BDV24DRAFT_140682 [Aspergillus arachidicola]|uniref:Uncharacterized protein n=1 Tax=Aspergillus arachidicola TaxID=656916 RepID=A0A5N6XXR6_9EURO|nr:hypothetical protein BDV24DRAFT_140682 [Aspergillus arachidicola]